ncbi:MULTISPECIES: hypothetical protein [Bacillus cereus group]|uniref:HTH merR-type domain-containing protein n=2 Tax=root TaxID=1 RepID=A0A1B1P785_9CAUD|nr:MULTISPECIES: hypothetical protein [Bacillus cereus group]YP_009830665.1 hypothetical protein HWA95_gp11 [Bacillus phage vB_BtS_BMBtp14]ANT39971.1 hypothetical protein BMBtpLA2_11 [Bacillus phage vB_BtS_BMBtp14]EEM55857.1 hypothetical protein bthur0007_63170 [Bacillus thuringiensis serovar monterrey BGSC 4AJ1]MEB9673614.1 hypothetical protein [Bacillus anthracis]OTX09784.1 hypothetical protein BK705_04165 [Bacillus thuringiensis serovar monterrey]OTX56303.1 hypothetical protein BK724_00090
MKEWYSIQEAADTLGISHTSISRYLHTYPDFFKVKSVGRKKMIFSEGLPLLRQIKELYAKGIQTHEILEQLQGSIPVYHDVSNDDDNVVNDFSLAKMKPFLKNLEIIVTQQRNLSEQNTLLVEQVIKSDQRAEQIHEQLLQSDKRNQELQGKLQDLTDKMNTLIEMQEAAATTEKQPWYKRILK